VIVGSVLVVLASARPLAQRIGKRRLGMYSMLLFGLCEPTAMTLRLIGVLPANGDSALMPILLLFWFVGFIGIIMAMTIWGTMIADVADEYELKTGARQEGLLYSAGTFLQKSATGGGGVFASAILYFAKFPEHAETGVSQHTINLFGVLSASITAGLAWLGAYCFSRFALEGAQHVAVLAQLKAKRGTYAPPAEPETEVAAIAGLAASQIER
jgi:glycoside/pentoside/hexuronide:cation symporter, GPH family